MGDKIVCRSRRMSPGLYLWDHLRCTVCAGTVTDATKLQSRV